ALDHRVDAEVADHALDGRCLLAAAGERGLRLVAAAAADLVAVVHDAPADLGVPELGDRGLEADVEAALVDDAAAEIGERLHRVERARHVRELAGDLVVPADVRAPLVALGREASRDAERLLRAASAAARDREPSRVERDESELEPLALLPQEVLARDLHVREA